MTEPAAALPRTARGPYRNSAETRARLIETSLFLFGSAGFDASSTRDIAARAGVALPAIAYHFGSKEGLYRACAEHVVGQYRARMQDVVDTLSADMPQTRDAARHALRAVTTRLAGMLSDNAGNDDGWMTFMMREMNGAGLAHDLLYRDLWEPGLALVASLAATIRGRSAVAEEDRLDALLLLSSFSAFTTARQVALDFGKWPAVDQSLVDAIVARLHAQVDAL